ncbi:MAG: hypothetical protein ABIO05_02655 [Ferruginibacter sp.]
MKKSILSVAIMLALAASASAQDNSSDYTTAIGVKFYPGAITLKHFVNSKAAVEGLGYFFNRGFRVTGLYELHFDIADVSGLKWYVGPGAHVGFYNTDYKGGGTSIGVDGVLGLDYKIKSAPLNLSLDFQPSFEFGDFSGFYGWGGLSIRYVIK